MYPPPAVGDPVPANPLPGLRPWVTPKGDFGAERPAPTRGADAGRLRWHAGIDLGAPQGHPVLAMESGVVRRVEGVRLVIVARAFGRGAWRSRS